MPKTKKTDMIFHASIRCSRTNHFEQKSESKTSLKLKLEEYIFHMALPWRKMNHRVQKHDTIELPHNPHKASSETFTNTIVDGNWENNGMIVVARLR